jgi:DNA-directed RNA polymerase subunit L
VTNPLALTETRTMFSNYVASGAPLLTDPDDQLVGSFTLSKTSTTIANTLRRCILVDTRSVGFRADLTNAADPGVVIRKNTSVIFNEMLAHRLTLIPLAVRRLDDFDPTRYQCVLTVKNENQGPVSNEGLRHVTAGDFRILEKQEDGTFTDIGLPAAGAMFPADPITKQTSLIVTLRPQWNTEQPAEEIDLTAYPVIGRGSDHMGFCPVSQCSFENTLDQDPVRQEQFFNAWLTSFKKLEDPTAVTPEVLAGYRKEWGNMAVQRCFLVDERGEPNSFGFTIESVGVRSVKEIVAEGIQAVIALVSPYATAEKSLADLGVTTQPPDSRMNGLDIHFDGQEHTLGNLLQTLITDLYINDGSPDSPIVFAGYKIRHPLHRVMTLRLGFREGLTGDTAVIAKEIINTAAERARIIFEELGRNWAALVGGSAVGEEATVALEG